MAEGRLREVEEDAIYITEKRFAEQQEEFKRAAEKKAREDAKSKPVTQSETKVEVEDDKKGK